MSKIARVPGMNALTLRSERASFTSPLSMYSVMRSIIEMERISIDDNKVFSSRTTLSCTIIYEPQRKDRKFFQENSVHPHSRRSRDRWGQEVPGSSPILAFPTLPYHSRHLQEEASAKAGQQSPRQKFGNSVEHQRRSTSSG